MDAVMEKVWEGQRMNAAETAQLYQLPLEVLGSLAHRRRELAKAEADGRGNEIITYNVDANINYTNVCNVYCKFCFSIAPPRTKMPTSSPKKSWIRRSRKPFSLGETRS